MTFLIITILVIVAVLGIAFFMNLEFEDWQYDRLKKLVMRWDYIVAFVGLIATTFSIRYGVETVTIVGGIGALLAGLLGISAKNYYTNGEQNSFNTDSFLELIEDEDWEVDLDEDKNITTEE